MNKKYSLIREDFTKEDTWRVFRIMGEFVEGFETLSKLGPAVAIFGSSRTKRNDYFYKISEEIGRLLVKNGFAVITGAGPGLMEAANKGAKLAGGESVGLNIQVPVVQRANRYVTKLLEFRYFFSRKVMFAKYAKAFVVLPGGYGTMDEFFEAVTLVQTKRISPFPIILVGTEFWRGLLHWMKEQMVKPDRIEPQDLKIFEIVNTPEEVISTIKKFYKKNKYAE